MESSDGDIALFRSVFPELQALADDVLACRISELRERKDLAEYMAFLETPHAGGWASNDIPFGND